MTRQRGDGKEIVETLCGTCKFFSSYAGGSGSGSIGECLRYPPTMNTDGGIRPSHPLVEKWDWCGEYKELE